VKRVVGDTGTRVACLTVIPPTSELGGSSAEDTATSQRIKHLVLLREWAQPMGLPADQLTFHVLEAGTTADALLDFARASGAQHVVLGAPPRDMPFMALLGATVTNVMIHAPCTVTVVRPGPADAAPGP
jgi:nucleotide-binding universal stress UspA family protein